MPSDAPNIFAAPPVGDDFATSIPASDPTGAARWEDNVFGAPTAAISLEGADPVAPPAPKVQPTGVRARAGLEPVPARNSETAKASRRAGSGHRRSAATRRSGHQWVTRAAALAALSFGAITGVTLIGKLIQPSDSPDVTDRGQGRHKVGARAAPHVQRPGGRARASSPPRLRGRWPDRAGRTNYRSRAMRSRPLPTAHGRTIGPARAPKPSLAAPPPASDPVPVVPPTSVSPVLPAPVPPGGLPEFP